MNPRTTNERLVELVPGFIFHGKQLMTNPHTHTHTQGTKERVI
jgi:hypothetical protein